MSKNEILIEQFRETGDRKYVNQLAAQNIGLVTTIASKYWKNTPNHLHDDLSQVGWEGFMRALDLYDPEKKFRFSTYAAVWIRSKIQRFLEHNVPMVRSITNEQSKALVSKYSAARNKLTAENPTISDHELQIEVAKICNCRPQDVDRVQFSRRMVYSLDAPIGWSNRSESWISRQQSDCSSPEENAWLSEFREDIAAVYESVMERKTERKQIATHMRLIQGCTLQQVGDYLGVSRERIRQIVKESLTDLRAAFESERTIEDENYN